MENEPNTENLTEYLKARAKDGLLPWQVQVEATGRFEMSYGEVEKAILDMGLLPARYLRNRGTVSPGGQLKLFKSCVAVVGCGGLGGYVIEALARLGVGKILAVDRDMFEEHNLNRQLFSAVRTLGGLKAIGAVHRGAEINPAVGVLPVLEMFSKDNGRDVLKGADVVVDGLDCIPTRLQLAEVCREMAIPLVHGSIAGWYGQVATQFPGDKVLETIYANASVEKGIETELGNPSFSPMVVAGLEAAEVAKILLEQGKLLRNRLLTIDLLNMEFTELEV